jgi:predicted AAA+ superfamily ATPase
MFERNAIEQLRRWASKNKRKPLVLRGARQVGKTTLVNQFSKDFETYLYLNLEIPQAHNLFETDRNIEEILTGIYLFCDKPVTQGKTLLFIDEIQNSPKAVMQLRYFYEKLPDLYVIAAGSLLESLINRQISFPVGRVEYMAIRPCCFDEFLSAMEENELRKALVERRIPENIHSKTISLFNTFTLIGGMPEVVSDYAQNRDLVSLNDTYETLLQGYRDDVRKYARNETMANVITYILERGWYFAGQRISLGNFAGSSYKAREMGEAFRTLEKAMLLELSYPTIGYKPPIITELKRKPKLFWLDTGLVNYIAKIQKEVFSVRDILDAWRGAVAEQIVAQELLSANNKLSTKRDFWIRDTHGADAEVDFILQMEDKIIPIEVKTGHNSKLKSLHIFMDNSNSNIAVRVWSNPFSIDKINTVSGKQFLLYNIPFYYVKMIPQLIDEINLR